jgi:hypothetical protein
LRYPEKRGFMDRVSCIMDRVSRHIHFSHRTCYKIGMEREYALYLQVGDRVYHKYYKRWGVGVVVEERRSEVPGGFCYVRIDFQDGRLRVFDNNFNSGSCCYYAGIEKVNVEKISVSVENRGNGGSRPRRKALPRGDE